jgi:hypothetical protein
MRMIKEVLRMIKDTSAASAAREAVGSATIPNASLIPLSGAPTVQLF